MTMIFKEEIMEDETKTICNPMLILDEYYAQLNEEEKIDGDDMFYDEVVKVELQSKEKGS